MSFLSMQRFTTLTRYSNAVAHNYEVMSHLDKVESLLKDLDRFEYGYMIARDSQFIRSIADSSGRVLPEMVALRSLTAENAEAQKTLSWLGSSLSLRGIYLRQNLAYLDSVGNTAPSAYYQKGLAMTQESIYHIDRLRTAENALLRKHRAQKEISTRVFSKTVMYLYLLFGAIALLMFVLLLRELRRRVLYQEELQQKLLELRRSHSELEQITFAASHDLQEPLRKIQVFSNRLLYRKRPEMDADDAQSLERIHASAGRMQGLIEDLVNLTSLTRESAPPEPVDLNLSLQQAMNELKDEISARRAVIHTAQLPVVQGNARQLQLLFRSLLDNALKFSRDDVAPEIRIQAGEASAEELPEGEAAPQDQHYWRISIADNGIGFDNKFMHKMFQIFQRLHTDQDTYKGKGMGLAICQRVMVNHKGFITGHGHPEAGATFKLYFPTQNGKAAEAAPQV